MLIKQKDTFASGDGNHGDESTYICLCFFDTSVYVTPQGVILDLFDLFFTIDLQRLSSCDFLWPHSSPQRHFMVRDQSVELVDSSSRNVDPKIEPRDLCESETETVKLLCCLLIALMLC